MSRRIQPALRAHVDDPAAAEIIRNLQRQLDEIKKNPLLKGTLIRDVLVPPATTVYVRHGLGHRAALFTAIPIQMAAGATTGRLLDTTLLNATAIDSKNVSTILATGFTVNLRLDIWAV